MSDVLKIGLVSISDRASRASMKTRASRPCRPGWQRADLALAMETRLIPDDQPNIEKPP
jgi:molybdopterin biosynthesis enzyme MoaB